MVKCPFCGFSNEDGALFCEQCKSDISSVAPAPAPPPAGPPPTPMPDSIPPAPLAAEEPIMAAVVDEKPVDIDLTFQEPDDRVWCSRQHALLVYDDATGTLTVEDLNSSNGTFVNRERVYPGQPRQLFLGNTIQIGTVHMKVIV